MMGFFKKPKRVRVRTTIGAWLPGDGFREYGYDVGDEDGVVVEMYDGKRWCRFSALKPDDPELDEKLPVVVSEAEYQVSILTAH
jgi:hypothetical protein